MSPQPLGGEPEFISLEVLRSGGRLAGAARSKKSSPFWVGPSVLVETLLWPQLKPRLIPRSLENRLGATTPSVQEGEGGSPALLRSLP